MIFLVFMLSVAFTEAVLRYHEKKQHEQKSPEQKAMNRAALHPAPSRPDSTVPVTGDLISLQHAIQNHASKEFADECTALPAKIAAAEENRYNRDGGAAE